MCEKDFDPCNHPLEMGSRSDFNYAEGKRNAEAYYFQKSDFPVAAVRIPFVMGINDYTKRLEKLIKAVDKGERRETYCTLYPGLCYSLP